MHHAMRMRSTPRIWEWPSVLCLEAPAIALLWQALSARRLGVDPGLHLRLLLGLAVWLSYTADRWKDAFSEAPVTPRHAFARRRRWAILGIWIAAACLGLLSALRLLTPSQWLLCAVGGAAAVIQITLIARLRNRYPNGARLWRFGAASTFTLGVLLFVLPNSKLPWASTVSWCIGVWIVVAGNLEVIAGAEARVERRRRGELSLSTQGDTPEYRRSAVRLMLTGILVLGAIPVWIAESSSNASVSLSALPPALAGLILADTFACEDPEVTHALADLAVALPAFAVLIAG